MRKIKLTKEERAVENSLEEYVPAGRPAFEEMARSIAARRKDMVLNIRVSSYDVGHIKQKAKKLGVKYQTFISEILHRAAEIS